jgi:ADP-ribose pyrophosphatase YjhB (NUDIX family)
MHGAAAVCFDADRVVLISSDGQLWGLPGGRPEPGEGWVDTLRREVLEEACAVVTSHRLLGFCRAACVRGPQAGVVARPGLVPGDCAPKLLGTPARDQHRRLVTPQAVLGTIWIEDGLAPMYGRVFADAGLPVDEAAR